MKEHRLLLLVALLPLAVSLALFWPALAGEMRYGNLPSQQQQALLQETYGAAPTSPLLERFPSYLDYDYHFVYEPQDRQIRLAFRKG